MPVASTFTASVLSLLLKQLTVLLQSLLWVPLKILQVAPKYKKHLLNRFCDLRNLIDQDLIQKA